MITSVISTKIGHQLDPNWLHGRDFQLKVQFQRAKIQIPHLLKLDNFVGDPTMTFVKVYNWLKLKYGGVPKIILSEI